MILNYSIQKHGASLLFLNRGFISFCLFLFSTLQAQDSLQITKMHIEGGATVYSTDTDFNKKPVQNLSTDYKSEKKEARNNGKNRVKNNGLSAQLAKIKKQQLQKYIAVQKSIKNQHLINLPKEDSYFVLSPSMKNSFSTACDKGFDAGYVCKSYKAKKKAFWLQKISKIHFKNTYQESSDFAFSYFSRPPPSLSSFLLLLS